MAYDVTLLCHLEDDLASLANDVRFVAERFGIPVENERVGDGWHAVEVGRADSGAAIVEIHSDDEATRSELRLAAKHLDDALLGDVNGIVVITLTGNVDEALIEGVTDLFRSSCRVVHDDVSGFVTGP